MGVEGGMATHGQENHLPIHSRPNKWPNKAELLSDPDS